MVKEKDKDVEQRLIDAGLRLIDEKGFDRVSVRDIIKAAGISGAGHFYYYFDSKDALCLAILQQEVRRDFSDFCEMLDIEGVPFSGFLNITGAELEEKSKLLQSKLSASAWGSFLNDPRFSEYFQGVSQQFNEALAKAVEKGIVMGVIQPAVSIEELGAAMHTIWNGWQLRIGCPFLSMDFEQMALSMRLMHKALLIKQ